MERRGSGFKKILADYEGQVEFDETKMPVFGADNDDFTLILYNLNYGSNYATHANEEKIQGDTQDDTEEKNHQNDKGKSESINGRYGQGIKNWNCNSKPKNQKNV